VTAVGGTSLSLNGTEVVWNGCQGVVTAPTGCDESGGGGGGVSSFEAKPTWQSGLVQSGRVHLRR
jgi:subtilase family serine protease